MKMSPLLDLGMFQAGIAVVERDPSIESLIELDLGSRKAETPVLRRDLKAASVPLYDIVVADDAFVPERNRYGADRRERAAKPFGGIARECARSGGCNRR